MKNSFVANLSTGVAKVVRESFVCFENCSQREEAHLLLALKPFSKTFSNVSWMNNNNYSSSASCRSSWLLHDSSYPWDFVRIKANIFCGKNESMSKSATTVFATLGALGAITSFCYVYKTRWEYLQKTEKCEIKIF